MYRPNLEELVNGTGRLRQVERHILIDHIRSRVPDEAILAQLAEECSEAAQAALKVRRALGCGSPTPVTLADATYNLNEELSDILLCVDVLKLTALDDAGPIYDDKLRRWIRRLDEEDIKSKEEENANQHDATAPAEDQELHA